VPSFNKRWAKDRESPLQPQELRDKKIAVDVSILMVKEAKVQQAAMCLFFGGYSTAPEHNVAEKLSALLHVGAEPIAVFDGTMHNPYKAVKAAKDRNKQRKKTWKQAIELLATMDHISGVHNELARLAKQWAKPHEENYKNLKRILRSRGIAVVQSPMEADAVIADMIKKGEAHFALSSDSDIAIRGGCPMIKLDTFNFDTMHGKVLRELPPLPCGCGCAGNEDPKETLLSWALLASIAGCDYGGVKKKGPVAAERLVENVVVRYGSVKRYLDSVKRYYENICSPDAATEHLEDLEDGLTEDQRRGVIHAVQGFTDMPSCKLEDPVDNSTTTHPGVFFSPADVMREVNEARAGERAKTGSDTPRDLRSEDQLVPRGLLAAFLECRGMTGFTALDDEALARKVAEARQRGIPPESPPQGWTQPRAFHNVEAPLPAQGVIKFIEELPLRRFLEEANLEKRYPSLLNRVETHVNDGSVTLQAFQVWPCEVRDGVPGFVAKAQCLASLKSNESYSVALVCKQVSTGTAGELLPPPDSQCTCCARAGGCAHLWATARLLLRAQNICKRVRASGAVPDVSDFSELPRPAKEVFCVPLPVAFVHKARQGKKRKRKRNEKPPHPAVQELTDRQGEPFPAVVPPENPQDLVRTIMTTSAILKAHGYDGRCINHLAAAMESLDVPSWFGVTSEGGKR